MGTKKVDTSIRKDQIARVVLEQIALHGLQGLSMAVVAHRLGLVPSALYRHYKGKEQMIESVFDLIHQMLFQNVDAACASSPDALECLRALLLLNIRMVREFSSIPRIIFGEGVFSSNATWKIRLNDIIRAYLARIRQLIEQGQQDARIRKDLDSQTIAIMFWGILPPAVILWHASDGRFDVTRHVERVWQVFSESIRIPPDPITRPTGGPGL